MSLRSKPSPFNAAITSVMAALFLASASLAVGAWALTPVEISTLSGVVFIAQLALSEMVRVGASSALSELAGSAAKMTKARKAVLRLSVMGVPPLAARWADR